MILLGVLMCKTHSKITVNFTVPIVCILIVNFICSRKLRVKFTAIKISIVTKGVSALAVIAESKEKIIVQELLDLAGDNAKNSEEFQGIVSGDYAEIVKVFGIDIAVKMYIHFRGCNISCPKHFYTQEYVVSVASQFSERRERERVAITCGYTSHWIERKVREVLGGNA